MKRLKIIALLCIVAVGIVVFGPLVRHLLKTPPPITLSYADNDEILSTSTIVNLPMAVSGTTLVLQPKVNWVEQALPKLSKCESGDKPEIKVLDTNNKYSYGLYQYQEGTWIGFYNEFVGTSNPMDYINDGPTQTFVTRKVLETYGKKALSHWQNCSEIEGLHDLF